MNTQRRTRLLDLLRRLEVNRAVFYAVCARFWQLGAGLATALLIAVFFKPAVQGYYYTFASLLALQTIADLGFQWVIGYVSSHEWAHLDLDDSGRVRGDSTAARRLASLVRLSSRWYGAAACVFVVVLTVVGFMLFSRQAQAAFWQGPWLAALCLTGLSLALSPRIAALEGCNQVAVVYRYRLLQAVAGNVVVWTAILLGANLWVVVAAAGVQVAFEWALVFLRYERFWASLPTPDSEQVDWQAEIWPLQWRIGVQSAFRYFAFYLFTPVMLSCHGAEWAGRMGMCWAVMNAAQLAAFAWVRSRSPQFGMLIARGEYDELDRVFRRVTAISWAVLGIGLAAFVGVVWALNQSDLWLPSRLAERLLPPLPTLVFSLAILLSHLPQCLGVYLRAHKQDPLLKLTVTANGAIAAGVLVFGGRYGATAAGAVLLAVIALWTLPGTIWIWRRCRRDWHAAE